MVGIFALTSDATENATSICIHFTHNNYVKISIFFIYYDNILLFV